MRRSELIRLIYERKSHLDYQVIEAIVRQIFQQLMQVLTQRRRVEIRGFGSFSLRYHKPRSIWNPKMNKFIFTEGKYVAYFKPSKALRNRVNESKVYFYEE